MNLNEILDAVETRPNPKRRGRGEGSGLGKSAGRGNKGAKARSGWRRRYGYEGGQMPLSRRVPKRGFNNFNFGKYFDCVNVGTLGEVFEDGATVNRQVLVDRGILKPRFEMLKVLGDGELKKKLAVTVHTASVSAKAKIEAAGGTLTCLLPPRKPKFRPKPKPAPAPAEAKGEKKKEKAAKGGEGTEKAPKKEKKEKKAETPGAQGADTKKAGKKGEAKS
jgi:large subunit ribosomal protein L15